MVTGHVGQPGRHVVRHVTKELQHEQGYATTLLLRIMVQRALALTHKLALVKYRIAIKVKRVLVLSRTSLGDQSHYS